jgi:hypothetical protein
MDVIGKYVRALLPGSAGEEARALLEQRGFLMAREV